MTPGYDLERFTGAQAPVWEQVRRELAAGCKQSHWMWFIFPQLAGLGSSPTARHFALADLGEAGAYLAHPLLGERLREATRLVLGVEGRSAHAIFGSPDDLKFRSSMTLFARLPDTDPLFARALARYFDGLPDPRTIALLAGPG